MPYPQNRGLVDLLGRLQQTNSAARAGLTPRATRTQVPAGYVPRTTTGGAFGLTGPKTSLAGMRRDPGSGQPYWSDGTPPDLSGYYENVVAKQFGGAKPGTVYDSGAYGTGQRQGFLGAPGFTQAQLAESAANAERAKQMMPQGTRTPSLGVSVPVRQAAAPVPIEQRYGRLGLLPPSERGELVREKAVARADTRRSRLDARREPMGILDYLAQSNPAVALQMAGMQQRGAIADADRGVRRELGLGQIQAQTEGYKATQGRYAAQDRMANMKAANEAEALAIEYEKVKNYDMARAKRQEASQLRGGQQGGQQGGILAPPGGGNQEGMQAGVHFGGLINEDQKKELDDAYGDPRRVADLLTHKFKLPREQATVILNQIYGSQFRSVENPSRWGATGNMLRGQNPFAPDGSTVPGLAPIFNAPF